MQYLAIFPALSGASEARVAADGGNKRAMGEPDLSSHHHHHQHHQSCEVLTAYTADAGDKTSQSLTSPPTTFTITTSSPRAKAKILHHQHLLQHHLLHHHHNHCHHHHHQLEASVYKSCSHSCNKDLWPECSSVSHSSGCIGDKSGCVSANVGAASCPGLPLPSAPPHPMDDVSPPAGSSRAFYPVPRTFRPADGYYNLLEGLRAPRTSPPPAPSKAEPPPPYPEDPPFPEGAAPMDFSSSPGLGYSGAGQDYPAAAAAAPPNPLSLLSEVALGGGGGPGSSETGLGRAEAEGRRKRVHSAGADGSGSGHSKSQRGRPAVLAWGSSGGDDDSEDEDEGLAGPPLGARSGRRRVDDGPSAPDLQLDWVSSSDSDSDVDSCIEVLSDAPRGRPVALVDLTGESDGEVAPSSPPDPAPPLPPTSSGAYGLPVVLGRPVATTAPTGFCRTMLTPEVSQAGGVAGAGAGTSCGCPRTATLGAVGLSASGAGQAAFSMEPQHPGAGPVACYGACLHPHHHHHHATPHHHHHHHHHKYCQHHLHHHL